MQENKKLKIVIAVLVIVIVALAAVAFYFARSAKIAKNTGDNAAAVDTADNQDENSGSEAADGTESKATVDVDLEEIIAARPSLLSNSVTITKPEYTVNTEPYTVNADLSNLDNIGLYEYTFRDVDIEQLANDYFLVDVGGWDEFFQVYEFNRYDYQANFVTVDSLMHTYHLYFAHLLKNLEKNELAPAVSDMSLKLLNESNNQYSMLKGSEWEEAAKRNVEFFTIGAMLQGNDAQVDSDIADIAKSEIAKINSAEGIDICALTDDYEDYTQYIPRGYYEGDDALEAYFKTMMWYGRIQFNSESDEMLKSSMLMTVALNNSGLSEWQDVYDITAFFSGTSDDLGYYEYYPLIEAIYGQGADAEELKNNTAGYDAFKKEVKNLRLPQINSIPIEMGEDNLIPGFRLMGQRFCIDAAIFQKLIYQSVEANSEKQLRMLPDVLDVAAALGSDTAYDLLKEQGDTEYANYSENMEALRKELSGDIADQYMNTNLSASWLNTLRPLLKEKGEGYPSFMQSEKWTKKDLECFAGSYTELKHDTILYAKQAMAEMGGGDMDEYDDRGYVQPEPEVYSRFTYLADATKKGFEERGRLSNKDADNLDKLKALAESLLTISIKELQDETLTDEEYDLIREYGGTLEHFWYEVASETLGQEYVSTEEFKAALVADVATDPNGQVLELGTGCPATIYVICKVDGKVKLTRGSVFTFYQFAWPMSDRLNDTKWRQMMKFEPLDNGWFSEEEQPVDRIWWSESYVRRPWEW